MARFQYKPYPSISFQDIECLWTFSNSENTRLTIRDLCLQYDDESEFNSEEQDLFISCTMTLFRFRELFGSGAAAVIPLSGRIGACIRWSSQTSRQRGSGEAIYFDSGSDSTASVALKIPASTLRGRIDFELIIFFAGCNTSREESETNYALSTIAKKPASPAGNQFASLPGSILFQSEPKSIRVDGKGSLFPVFYVEEPGRPLWRVNLNIDDPQEQLLEMDTVSLYINTSHPDFNSICQNQTREITNIPMLKQIYASVFMLLLTKLGSVKEWWDAVKNFDRPNNTLCGLANYWNKFVLDDIDPVTEPNKLFEKLLSILDTKLSNNDEGSR